MPTPSHPVAAPGEFVALSPDGIARFDVTPAVPVDQPEDAVIDALYANARPAEHNAAFARLHPRGDRLNDLLVRDDPATAAVLEAFVRGGFRVAGAETQDVDPNGRPRWLVTDLAGVVEADRLVGVWLTRRDVTAAKLAEADLRRARDAAEAASRAKSAFLANVSHEIRTPLNGVLGMAHLVLQDDLTAAQRERVRVLKTSADSLLHVLNDLLDFSKMEAGKFRFSPAPFHLADELGETMTWLALRAHEKGLRLAFYLAPDVPAVVVADAGRLRQALVNLVGNAIKFTERGEVVVRVGVVKTGVRPDSHPGLRRPHCVHLEFVVTDTGIGIPADRLAGVFEPFEQADPGVTRRFGGTGLGLAIVTRLAAMMGGTVAAESEPGRGSTFRLTARVETTGGRLSPPTLPPRFDGLRVLAVDAHPLSRGLLLEQLVAWGLDAHAVADPTAAVDLARAAGRPFELVILDARGEVADTLAAVRHLRDNGVGRPAVVCVPAAGWHDRSLARAETADLAFLARPFKPAELLDALVGVLRLTPPAWLASRRAEATPPPAPALLRILLAEDNAVNQAVAVGLLKAAGHTVRVAGNGRAAVDALAAEPFDVVLMDVQMPEMDGFEATAAIRAAEAGTGRRLPIIALTAKAMAGDREECLRRGMDDFVAKPIQPTELYQVLGRLRPLPAAAPVIATVTGLGEAETGVADPGSRTTVLDEAGFRGRCGGRDELVRRVARLFLSECPRYLDRLRSALAVGDAAALRVAAHTVKGAVGNLSAGAAFASASSLEDLAREGDLTAAAAGLAALEAELGRLRPALRSLLAVERPTRGRLVART